MVAKYYELTCVICGKEFRSVFNTTCTCDKQCEGKYRIERHFWTTKKRQLAEEANRRKETEEIAAINKKKLHELYYF